MGENITKIKVGDDVHCISLDTLVIHPDTQNYLQPEPYGISLKLDTMAKAMAKAMAEAMAGKLGFVIDGYNDLKIGTAPLRLGTGLKAGDSNKELCLSLGSGLEFTPGENKIRLKINEGQQLLMLMPDGTQTINLDRLYYLLESRYNLTKK